MTTKRTSFWTVIANMIFVIFSVAVITLVVLPNTPSLNSLRYEVALMIAPSETLQRVETLEAKVEALQKELVYAKTVKGSLENVVVNPVIETYAKASESVRALWNKIVE